jgi:hypothetical protein
LEGKNIPTSNKSNITKERRKEQATYIVDFLKKCNTKSVMRLDTRNMNVLNQKGRMIKRRSLIARRSQQQMFLKLFKSIM